VRHDAGNPTVQYEDANYDGKVDTQFDLATQQPMALDGSAAEVSAAGFEKLVCTGFNDFWKQAGK
jgi:hypothetical protein